MKEYRFIIGEPGVSATRIPPKLEHTLHISYIGYREIGGTLIKGKGTAFYNCSNECFDGLFGKIKHYSVIRAIAAPNPNSKDFFDVQEVLEISVPPLEDEMAFMEQAKVPITFTDTQFGKFTLDKSIDWYEGTIDYQGKKIRVMLDSKDEDIETLRFVYRDLKDFIEGASRYAAKELLELGNEWQQDGWEENEGGEFVPMTEEDFIKRISLNTITFSNNGSYTLWFDDGDIFWGHSVNVYGDIESGFANAMVEG